MRDWRTLRSTGRAGHEKGPGIAAEALEILPEWSSLANHFHHVRKLGDGAADLCGVLQLDNAVHLAQAKTDKDPLLVLRTANGRADLFDLDDPESLERIL
jgi:hypothetical protein